MSWILPLLLLLLLPPLVVGLMRINELFFLRSQDGKLHLVRGRIPQPLLTDLTDVLRAANLDNIQLRGVIEDGRAKLYAEGGELDTNVRQQLRNTISLWPVAKIRNAPKRTRP